jgi:hypothetical protein
MHRASFAHHSNGAARQGRARPPGQHCGFFRLVEIDAVKTRPRSDLAFRGQNGLHPSKFGAGQCVKGMRRLRFLGRAGERQEKQCCGQQKPRPIRWPMRRSIHAPIPVQETACAKNLRKLFGEI